ncbi:MAG: DinB family protein [Planctomycetota bacterium]
MLSSNAAQFFSMQRDMLKGFLEDVPADRWTEQPAGVRNHPAWTLGHLASSNNFILAMLGKEGAGEIPDAQAKYGNGSLPTDNPSDYLSKDELWAAYDKSFEAASAALAETTDEQMANENPVESVREFFPTVGFGVAYMTMAHQMDHLGQLRAWKRAAGLAKG